MRILITIALIFVVSISMAQSPKEHVYYDTVKTVSQRIDYAPDTIPVYFKEVVITHHSTGLRQDGMSFDTMKDSVNEIWQKGFIVWQTYVKRPMETLFPSQGTAYSDGSIYINKIQPFYQDEYEPSRSIPGIFLYADKKTKCKNLVIYSIKR